ncbi:MAG: ABC-2 transporter permease [Firmicutes bacterium]|nr:ABC-2 transporter permease [Bacillota bacterium]
MKNISGLLKIDTMLIAPYWKWLVMFFGIALLMSIVAGQSGLVFIISFTMFAGTFTAFNFENTEKSNLNVLYATLPTNRKSILFTRYIFILIVLVLSLIVAVGVGIIIDLAFGNTLYWEAFATLACISFAIYLFNTSFQTPFFYRFGYVKGKIFLWIPLIIIMIILNIPVLFDVFNLNVNFNIFEILFRNTTATSLIALAVGIVSITISYILSHKIYLKRDF